MNFSVIFLICWILFLCFAVYAEHELEFREVNCVRCGRKIRHFKNLLNGKWYCDKCKKEIKEGESATITAESHTGGMKFDLCHRCVLEVCRWIIDGHTYNFEMD